MKFFAIRHKPSGGFLPQSDRSRRGGFTHTVPTTYLPPRLFASMGAAKAALTWWLKGETSVHISRSYEGEYDEDWSTSPRPDRRTEEMEVVPVTLETMS